MIESMSDLDKLKGKSILQDEGKEQDGAIDNGRLRVGNVVPAMGDGSLTAAGNGEPSDKTCGARGKGDSKIETEADGHAVEVECGDGNSCGSGGGVDRPIGNGDAIKDPTLAALNRVGAKTRGKKKQKSPTIVETSVSQDASQHDKVSTDLRLIGTNSATKLLIFNVHGTLVDSSLLSESNPNSNIRTTRKSLTRRHVFRPWLTEFLDRCFTTFKVAFWGMKSIGSMEDEVAEMMHRFEGMDSHKPLFCWSAKDCVDVSNNSGKPKWKKPLSKVWTTWPSWNVTNTVIIDHIGALVDCNPIANIIIPPSFYVESLKKLADDKNYLRQNLWPLLEGLAGSTSVQEFQGLLPATSIGVTEVTTVHAAGRTTRSATLKPANSSMSGLPKLAGEGTCELEVHIGECPLTYVYLKLMWC